VTRWQSIKLDLASAPLKSGQNEITLLNELAEGWVLVAITGNLQAYLKQPGRSLRLPKVLRRWAIRLRHRHPAQHVRLLMLVRDKRRGAHISPTKRAPVEVAFSQAGRSPHLERSRLPTAWCRMPFHRTMRVHNIVQEITCVHLHGQDGRRWPGAPQRQVVFELFGQANGRAAEALQ
jgi:hypothetical protein